MNDSRTLAAIRTRAASKQTYYTIRLLADRELAPDAYLAYAYFRWVDDCLDSETGLPSERIIFLQRQQALLEACYQGKVQGGQGGLSGQIDDSSLSVEEQMLVDLVANDWEEDSGLQTYLRNMMAVMAFDVERRDRQISQAELAEYSRLLATAVTEAMHYFIGHSCPAPCGETRYLAVQGAHIVHMLRDLVEDCAVGYWNIPEEVVEKHCLRPEDVERLPYRKWVQSRVELAAEYFRRGREQISRVQNWRCRLAGYAYVARFEWMLLAIARDGYRLRPAYPERKSLSAGLWMFWRTLASMLCLPTWKIEMRSLALWPLQRVLNNDEI